ncbi:hypothetical protein KP509_33G020900 [Ceratopteris richardii]|uniref:Uncharacterized protein n=1 Tax=Ceratopteris richardii TaxID=49495 RepID=A0A8T2QMQ6_CERRI|nr:hypothetical protein KP509_33G020900 [Ceratopteris richardii]
MDDGNRSSCEDTGHRFLADLSSVRGGGGSRRERLPSRNGEDMITGRRSYGRHLTARRRAVVPTQGDQNYDLYYASADEGAAKAVKGATHLRGRPRQLLGGILKCICNSKDERAARDNGNQLAAEQLLERSRVQEEVLIETEETRDMWEWQMEQQQVLTTQEHHILEKQLSMNPSTMNYPYSLIRNTSFHRTSSACLLGENSTTAEQLKDQDAFSLDGHPNGAAQDEAGDRPSDVCTSVPSSAGMRESPHFELSRHLNDPDFLSATLLLFESTLLRCRSEINIFCRVYMQQMVLSGYTLVKTLMDMEPHTMFYRKVHASYSLESRICTVMFRCFENDSFDDSGVMQILDQEARAIARLQDFFTLKSLDPEEALAMRSPTYDAAFHHFCANKSEEIAAMFSWTMVYRNAGERDRFMEAFLRAAKWVWMLHRLANAMNPPVQIIRVGRGMEIHPMYVDVVTTPAPSSCPNCSASKVEFMIMPGFITNKTIFKAKVYQHYMCMPTSDQLRPQMPLSR